MTNEKQYSNLKEKAYEIIKNKIVFCEILPGTPLSENQLIKEIGSSRTPIREALNRLENENLIKIYPKRGIFITDITLKDVMDIYTVREAIEPLAARLACEHIDIEKVKLYLELFSRESSEFHLEEYLSVDRDFHSLIAKSTENFYLEQILMRLYDQNHRIRIMSKLKSKDRQKEAMEEHLELVKCFIERDKDKAERIMKQHVTNGKRTAMKVVTG